MMYFLTRQVLIPAIAALALGGTFIDAAAEVKGPQQSRLNTQGIGAAAGTEATTTDDGVVRIGWSRNAVQVSVDGMRLKPFAGLGAWAAFKAAPHRAMVMGDTVLFQEDAHTGSTQGHGNTD